MVKSASSQDEIEATGSLPLDYSTLLSDATVQRLRSNIAEDIINHPERTLNSVALALHTVRTLLYCRAIPANVVCMHAMPFTCTVVCRGQSIQSTSIQPCQILILIDCTS